MYKWGVFLNLIYVDTKENRYPIYFEKGFDGIKDAVKEAGLIGRKVCIIADSNTVKLYSKAVKDVFEDVFSEIYTYSFEAGENNKNLDTIEYFYDFFLRKNIDRKTVVVCLGGGVCGDMAGFAAATYLRGIKFIQIPTTLLSQVDSSVGGKVGVDYKGSKNLIGAFYQPEFVYINIDTLDTLSDREFSAGMAEVIKYGPICSKEFIDYIDENKELIIKRDKNTLEYIIKKCCEFKADVVSQDEKESGLREILNFGHTIGHAVESKMGFNLLHGECVAMGMKAVCFMCLERGDITEKEYNDLCRLLMYFNLPLKTEGITAEEVYWQMFKDKKVKNNKINFVLLNKMGEPFSTDNVDKEEIYKAINMILG